MQSVIQEQGPVIVEKSGKPQIVLLSVDHYRRLQENKAQNWLSRIEQTHALIEAEHKGEAGPDAAETVRTMREERDVRLLDLP